MNKEQDKNTKKDNCDKNIDKKIKCNICGAEVWSNGMKRHEKSKKHKEVKYLWLEKFEIYR